jgi:hypothetical protein
VARSELRQNLKFRKLQKLLSIPVPFVVGLLECLWQCGYESGSDFLGSDEDVEMAAEWPYDAGKFVKALASTRFIDKRGENWHIHDLYENAPDYVKKKMNRKSELRTSNDKYLRENSASTDRKSADNGEHEISIDRKTAENVRSNNPSTNPIHPTHITHPDVRHASDGVSENGDALVESIYEAYPRKVGKSAALTEIKNALKKIKSRGEQNPGDFLLNRVRIYGQARRRIYESDPSAESFTPHPERWFKKGRYDDDPREWEPKLKHGEIDPDDIDAQARAAGIIE